MRKSLASLSLLIRPFDVLVSHMNGTTYPWQWCQGDASMDPRVKVFLTNYV